MGHRCQEFPRKLLNKHENKSCVCTYSLIMSGLASKGLLWKMMGVLTHTPSFYVTAALMRFKHTSLNLTSDANGPMGHRCRLH